MIMWLDPIPDPCMRSCYGSGGRKKSKKSDWDDNSFCLLSFIPIGPIIIPNPGWVIKKLEEND